MADDSKQEQIDLAASLQMKWLKRMDKMFDDNTITSTDMATLVRFLMANGWTLDVSRLPQGLKSKLTAGVSADDFSGDADVLPFARRG